MQDSFSRLSIREKQRISIAAAALVTARCNAVAVPPTGLISAAPGRRNAALQQSAKQVENMVRNKMEQREYIILCLEDSNDWSNATSRRLVMQASQRGHRLCTSLTSGLNLAFCCWCRPPQSAGGPERVLQLLK